MSRTPAFFLAFLAWFSASAASQTQSSLTVRVLDSTGGALVGATCELQVTPPRIALVADDGRCRFDGVGAGDARVLVSLAGFTHAAVVLAVEDGRAGHAEVTLQPAGLLEEVVVSATRVATPVSALPNTVTILDAGVLEQRTAASDDLASLLEARVPGFGPSMKKLTGRGESLRGRNPLYTINGVPQHTPLRDGERDGHTIDLDFVERIEVIHGSNAIQGIGATGGVVNMVTKSPKRDGRWTHDVKLSVGNSDSFEGDGWTSKASYLVGKKSGNLDFLAGGAWHQRGLFYDARGQAIGLYPTQGDIMDSTSRSFYAKAGVDFGSSRRLEASVNNFTLERDGEFVPVAGNRRTGLLTTSVPGDPRAKVGDPAQNDVTTVSIDYRDRDVLGGDVVVQAYLQDYWALFEGGAFTTFALNVGGPAFLDQSAITTDKLGAKVTWAARQPVLAGVTPMAGIDFSRDKTAQVLARTGRAWVPEMVLGEVAPFLQLQRTITSKVLLSGGLRYERAELSVDDYTTLPSSRSTLVRGGSPSFTRLLPNVGVVVYPSARLSVYGSFSEGFTMPDAGRVLRAVNVAGQSVDGLLDIEPIVTGNLEFGADWRSERLRLHGAFYRSAAERGSLLERTADDVYRVRRDPTAIHGVDATAEVPLHERWSVGATYAWLRGRFDANRDGSLDTDLDGLNIAPNRLNLFVEGAGWRAVSGRLQVSTLMAREFKGVAAPVGRDFGGYTTADLSLAVPTRAGTIRLGIENLLDKQYVLYFSQVDPLGGNDTFFAGPGRSFLLGFERRF